jgi:pimeloyl-ACP methyl ester carboxylesterase
MKFRRGLRSVLMVVGPVLLALLGASTILGLAYDANTEIPKDLSGHSVMVLGVPLRVLQAGSGRDVLLIHGSPGSLEDWSPIVERLSGSMRVTAFDRPGHGFSGDPGVYSPSDNARFAEALIARLGLQHTIVVGHSYGGATALALALRAPPSIAAYVTIDSSAYAASRRVDPTYPLLALPVVGMGLGTLLGSALAPSKIRNGLTAQFRGVAPSREFIALRTRIWSAPKVTHAIARETLGANDALATQSAQYGRIDKPVFILGQADDPLRAATAQRLHADIPHSSLTLVPDSGHYIQFQKPEVVVDTIRRAAAL